LWGGGGCLLNRVGTWKYQVYRFQQKKGGYGALDADNAEIVLVQFLLHQEMVELLHVQLLAPGMTVLLPALAALVLSAAPYLVSNVAKSGFVELGQHVPNPVEQHKLGNFHIYKGPNHSQTIGFSCAVLRNNGTRILHRCQQEVALLPKRLVEEMPCLAFH
jgi:hypothetical protein